MRDQQSVDEYLQNIDVRPEISIPNTDSSLQTPGYPQGMKGMSMSEDFMKQIWSRREVQGMRANWPESVEGLMTTLRVLPKDLYHKVMETEEPIEKGGIFAEIVNRFGTPGSYKKATMEMKRGKNE